MADPNVEALREDPYMKSAWEPMRSSLSASFDESSFARFHEIRRFMEKDRMAKNDPAWLRQGSAQPMIPPAMTEIPLSRILSSSGLGATP